MNTSTRSALTRRAVLAAGVAAVPLLASRPASAAGTFPDPGPNVPIQATIGYDDMIRELGRIERSSRIMSS